MAYAFSEARIMGKLAVASIISAASVGVVTQNYMRPGTRTQASDPTLGEGDFIFLPTIASVVIGSVVNFRQSASGVYTTIMVPNTGNLAYPVAVAMAAGAANNYGWFQLAGTAVIKKTAAKINPNVALYISSTTGRVTATAACGKQVLAARSANSATVASATSTVTVTINYPHMQGGIT